MENIYTTLAESYEKLAEGFRALAGQAGHSDNESAVSNNVEKAETPKKKVTIEQVRAVMSAKSDEGKTAQVKALLLKYDAGKLSGVKPEDYADLLREVEAL